MQVSGVRLDRLAEFLLQHHPLLPLGLGGDRQITQESLEPGDRLLLFTDGVTEARDGDGDGQFFGVQRLAELEIRQPGSRAAGQPGNRRRRRRAG